MRETTTIIILLELVFQGSSRSSKVFKVFKGQLSQVAIYNKLVTPTYLTSNREKILLRNFPQAVEGVGVDGGGRGLRRVP